MSFLIGLPSLFDSGTATSTAVGSNRCNKLPGVPSFRAGLRPRIPGTNKKTILGGSLRFLKFTGANNVGTNRRTLKGKPESFCDVVRRS